jgi:hypothetical protein
MRITKKTLRTIIKEELSNLHSGDFREWEEFHEGRDQEAISHAKSMRSDNLNFQDFAGLIVDKLNLYDEWVENKSVEDVVADLTGGSQGIAGHEDWDPEEADTGYAVLDAARRMSRTGE